MGDLALLACHLLGHLAVLAGACQYRNVGPVLGRGPYEAHAADVYHLEGLSLGDPLSYSLLEGIQVDCDEVDRDRTGVLEVLHILLGIPSGQDSGEDPRMGCLDATLKHLAPPGVVSERVDLQPLRLQVMGRSAAR